MPKNLPLNSFPVTLTYFMPGVAQRLVMQTNEFEHAEQIELNIGAHFALNVLQKTS
jgi:hypothetical protein